MPEAKAVLVPLLNPNEPEALVAAMHVQEGQSIQTGDLLCTFETTKSTADLLAEADGYVAGLKVKEGQTAHAGEVLCYLAGSPNWQPPAGQPDTSAADSLPSNLRITQPALKVAQLHNLDLNLLPVGELITEQRIQDLLARHVQPLQSLPDETFDPEAIVIYGGGGHGKALIDLLCALGRFPIAGVLDDRLVPGTMILDVPVLGGAAVLGELKRRGVTKAVNAVGGIGNVSVRIKVFEQLAQAGFTCPALVHPRATVEPSAQLADGVQIFPHAYIGSSANIGYGVIVNTGAIVSHDCQVAEYANLSPGSILAGEVQIGYGVLVGMGATINLQVHVGDRVRIGNSATVKKDVPAGGIVRAGGIWPSD